MAKETERGAATTPDYELANQEAEKAFSTLGLSVTVSAPIADVRDEWPNILFYLNFSKGGKNLPCQYRMGVGHVKWPKTYEQIPHETPSDLIPVFNTLRHNPSAILKNKAEHARAAVVLAMAQKVSAKPYQVFACMCEESLTAHSTSFSEYCAELGMNADSIKAKSIYEFCADQYHKIVALVDRKTVEQFAEYNRRF